MFCFGCENPRLNQNTYKSIALQITAVFVMVQIDTPVCHRIANMLSLTTSTLVLNLLPIAEYAGYYHTNYQFTNKTTLTTEAIHNHIHEAIEEIEHSNDGHDDSEHHHTFIASKLEVMLELSMGIAVSSFLPKSWIKIAHNLDIMHVIPGWNYLESTVPDLSNGHGVAESIAFIISVTGPINDIFFRGLDPKQVQQIYWDKSPMPTIMNCYTDMQQCQKDIYTLPDVIMDSFGHHNDHDHTSEITYYADEVGNTYCLDA